MTENADQIIKKCKSLLENHYGERFKGLLLYGSVARNQAERSSDIDLMVLLEKPINYAKELRQIIDLLYDVQLESEQLISAKPAAAEDFNQGSIQLYRNVQREGQLVT